jgi:hypothetical protein
VRPDVESALGIASGDPVCILQMLWTLSRQPAAATTTYLACDSAIGITVNYAEPADGHAAALTVAVLRPSEFRVIVDSVVALAQAADVRNPLVAQPRATG